MTFPEDAVEYRGMFSPPEIDKNNAQVRFYQIGMAVPPIDHPKAISGKVNKKRRYYLWSTCHQCFWCELKLRFEEATVDHLIPKSKGGKNHNGNLVISCFGCNQKKKDEIWLDPAPYLKVEQLGEKLGDLICSR